MATWGGKESPPPSPPCPTRGLIIFSESGLFPILQTPRLITGSRVPRLGGVVTRPIDYSRAPTNGAVNPSVGSGHHFT